MKVFRSNLTAPDLEPAFIHARPLPRSPFGHAVLHEPEIHPRCGFMTHDEAAILYTLAKGVGGTWLEIGSFCGWSAAHLAAAGCAVLAVDPDFGPRAKSRVRDRAERNLERAGVAGLVELCGQTSAEFFEPGWDGYFDGVFIDGDHDAPQPLLDAQRALPALAARGVIVFHDYAGQPIRDAVEWLRTQGLSVRIYHTPAQMAVCWRGAIGIPEHTPDPECVR